jgi:hypothetical protein
MITYVIATALAVGLTIAGVVGIAMVILADISDREWERALRSHLREIEEQGD